MKVSLGRRTVMLGTVTTIVVGVIALAVLGAGGIVAWEYSNSNAFCTNNCHAVHPEEPRAYAAYSHARVQCVECHMGRLPTLQLMTLKAAHYHELLGMVTGYKRPLTATTLRPARDSCEGCHWPSINHDDKVRTKVHYGADAKSTEQRTRLIVHIVDAAPLEGTPDPVHAYRIVRKELAAYSDGLAKRREIVVANKLDLTDADAGVKKLKKAVGKDVVAISAVAGTGLEELRRRIVAALAEIPTAGRA